MKALYRYLKLLFKKIIYLLINDFPVAQLVHSIPEVILNKDIASHVTAITVIRNACVEKYSFKQDLPIAFRPDMHFARRHVYRMNNVNVVVKTGACFSEHNGFLESLGSLRSWLLSRPIHRKKYYNIAVAAPVTCINTTGFAHFIIEELPRFLWALKQYPEVKLICPVKIPGYASDIYTLLRKKKIMQQDPIIIKSDNVTIDDFIFTQAEAYSGFWHKLDLDILRETFLMPVSYSKNLKIYISRRLSKRTFSNEVELEKALVIEGFQIVYLEKLKFIDQIEMFSNAAIVIASHGAGLANIVWCAPNTKVIELFSSNVFNDCFARLSSQLSCAHYILKPQNKDNSCNVTVNEVIELLNKI